MGGKRNYGKRTPFATLRENYNSDKDKRKDRMTQEKLGKMLGVSGPTISKYESGEMIPGHDIVQGYARIFKVSTDYLLGTTTPSQSTRDDIAYRKLGLTDDAVKTIKMITENSSAALDLSALLNAFLSGGEHTVLLFQSLLRYLENDDNEWNNMLLLRELKPYLRDIVEPKIQTAIRNSQRENDAILEAQDQLIVDTPACPDGQAGS